MKFREDPGCSTRDYECAGKYVDFYTNCLASTYANKTEYADLHEYYGLIVESNSPINSFYPVNTTCDEKGTDLYLECNIADGNPFLASGSKFPFFNKCTPSCATKILAFNSTCLGNIPVSHVKKLSIDNLMTACKEIEVKAPDAPVLGLVLADANFFCRKVDFPETLWVWIEYFQIAV